MWSKQRRCGVALVVLAAVVSVAWSAGKQTPPTAGAVAPDFTLMNQDDKPVRLGQYKGRWVVLYFYPADFSPGGMLQARNFERDLAKYRQANAVILGVSGNATAKHRELIAKEGLHFELLSDAELQVSREYGSTMRDHTIHTMTYTARNTFLIDPSGKVAKVFVDVVPEHHSEEVLQALATLQR